MFVMALYNVVDTIFIGRAVGTLGIAGLSIVFPVQMLMVGTGQMIGIGGASLLSRSLGSQDMGRAERTLGNAVFLVCVLGVTVTAVGLAGSSFWLRLLGASEDVLPYARAYFNIIVLATTFRVFAMSANGLVRAEGNARTPMMAMVVGAGLNIVLDAVFILGLRMGVAGAATATVVAELVSATYLLSYYLRHRSSVRMALHNIAPERSVLREILAVGASSFVRTTAGSMVIVFVNRSLVTYGGDVALAAFGVLHRVLMFLFMPLISIGQGLLPILGFSYGAGRYDRAYSVVRLSIIVGSTLAAMAFCIIFFFPAPIISIFTADSALISTGAHGARLMFAAAFLVGFQIVGSVLFQAIGKALPAFITAISRNVLFFLPTILLLPRFLGLDGVWASFPVADSLAFLLTFFLALPQIRRFRKAVRESAGQGETSPAESHVSPSGDSAATGPGQ